MNLSNMKKKLQINLSKKRWEHSLGVMETSVRLAQRYDVSISDARMAGLLHDCAKYPMDIELLRQDDRFDIMIDDDTINNPSLIHAPLGVFIAREEYEITDQNVLDAIHYHTTGRRGMSKLEMIVYVADAIEPNREYPAVKRLRKIACVDLKEACVSVMDETIRFCLSNRVPIHPNTILARNDLLLEGELFEQVRSDT